VHKVLLQGLRRIHKVLLQGLRGVHKVLLQGLRVSARDKGWCTVAARVKVLLEDR
jgi:hypothetical protein